MFYVVYKIKIIDGARHLSLISVHDDNISADSECTELNLSNDASKANIFYSVCTVSDDMLSSILSECAIKCAEKVAMCLSLFDINLKKRGVKSLDRASHCFERALYFSKVGARYLD